MFIHSSCWRGQIFSGGLPRLLTLGLGAALVYLSALAANARAQSPAPASPTAAQAAPGDAKSAEPKSVDATATKKVYVGIYLNEVDSVNLKDSQITVDFHIWFRWLEADFKADDTKPIDSFDLVNGQVTSKQDVMHYSLGEYHYAVCRVLANIHKVWNVAHFPFDQHELAIEIEDNLEDYRISYLADAENSNMNPEGRLAGWRITPGTAFVKTHVYNTNYGDTTLPTHSKSSYARFYYTLTIARPGNGMFVKLFTGLFIAVAISFVSLLIPASELDARFGLAVGAMFAAVASEYLILSSLPDANYLTIADRIHIISFVFIFLALAESALAHKFADRGRVVFSKWLDRVSFVAISASYCLLAYGIVVYR